MSRRVVFAAGAALLAGCAQPGTGPAAAPPSAPPSTQAGQEYVVETTVLEAPDHAPQLCLGAILASDPPQCRGPDVVGWDWAAVEGEQSRDGTRSGVFRVVGTWDGERLTLTERPSVPRPAERRGSPRHASAAPCPTPDGGWPIEDRATATWAGLNAARDYADAQPDLGAVWVDERAELSEPLPGIGLPAMLNISFTGDLARHEQELRSRYGGPLCVVEAPRAAAELLQVQRRVHAALGEDVLTTSHSIRGVLRVSVIVADEPTRERVQELDPDGAIELEGELQPVG